MSGCLDARAWAERNFSEAQLGDPRRTRRLVSSAARIALQPEKSFTQCFDWNELRAFYRLCNQKEATPDPGGMGRAYLGAGPARQGGAFGMDPVVLLAQRGHRATAAAARLVL